MSKDVRPNSFKILTETGQEFERNRRYLIYFKDQGNFEVEKSNDREKLLVVAIMLRLLGDPRFSK